MHKKTFNIAAVCLVALIVAFVVAKKEDNVQLLANNIEIENGAEGGAYTNETDEYQKQILKTVLDQNIKAFESVSESFKKQPTDTMSDTIAKNVFSQYIEYNTSKSLDIETVQAETLEAIKAHPIERSNLTLQDIRISGNTVTDLKNYVNILSAIQTESLRAINKVNSKENKNLYIKEIYKTTANLFLKQAVPESVAKEHLGIINGYRDYSHSFELLALQDKDPAKALTGVQLAKEAQDLLVASLSSVKNIVSLNKITFTQEDPAYVWFTGIAPASEAIITN